MKNYYKILRVNSNATIKEIKHSFRILAHKYHPDKNNINYSSENFLELKEAYDFLSDALKRQLYDKEYEKYLKYYTVFENYETEREAINHNEISYIFAELKKFKVEDAGKIVLEELLASLTSCKKWLLTIKKAGTINNATYLDISSTVVRNAIEISESILDSILTMWTKSPELYKNLPATVKLEGIISWLEAIDKNVITALKDFDMNETTREIYSLKNEYYHELKNDFEKEYSQKNKKEGCYIATMVYGDYNNSSVLVLRYYRDNILRKLLFGNQLINIYYSVSPFLVYCLKNNTFANSLIRKILDKRVRQIARKYCMTLNKVNTV